MQAGRQGLTWGFPLAFRLLGRSGQGQWLPSPAKHMTLWAIYGAKIALLDLEGFLDYVQYCTIAISQIYEPCIPGFVFPMDFWGAFCHAWSSSISTRWSGKAAAKAQ